MGTDQHKRKVMCNLCTRSAETEITGPLSTKNSLTAHQNCLFYSSGIFSENSPQFDDLFGFSVKHVRDELKRGSRLTCDKCKKKGATVGCEVKRCKKSYHYPCAREDGALNKEDLDEGTFRLYCKNHLQKEGETSDSAKRQPSSNRDPKSDINQKTLPKVICFVCDQKKDKISVEHTNSGIMSFCKKHKPVQEKHGNDASAELVSHSRLYSDSSKAIRPSASKRRMSFNGDDNEGPEDSASKRRNRTRIVDSSSSDSDSPETDLKLFAPIESSDLDNSETLEPKEPGCQQSRTNAESVHASFSGEPHETQNREEEETVLESDMDSESLLPTSVKCVIEASQASGRCPSPEQKSPTPDPHTPVRGSPGPDDAPPSPAISEPLNITSSPLCTRSPVLSMTMERFNLCLPSSHHSSPLPTSSREPCSAGFSSHGEQDSDSATFWRQCNKAGCTQAIFSDFISEIIIISNRIQFEQASQEDYNLSLRVMKASGKLAEIVANQERELQRKQELLLRAAAAMKEAWLALKR